MAKKKDTPISKRMQRRAERRRKARLTQIGIAAIVLVIIAGVFLALRGDNDPATAVVAQEPIPSNISIDETYEIYEGGGYLLDVRTQEEWDEYHIPGTTLIPLDELESRVEEVPRDQEVVVVCRSGNRSQVGRDILLQAGFSQVTSMDGGVSDWRESGYPTE
jgi:rhodanese-related sulfurtransferase